VLSNRWIQAAAIVFGALFLQAACANHPAPESEAENTESISRHFRQEAEQPPSSSVAFPKNQNERQKRPAKAVPPAPAREEASEDSDLVKVEWGREVTFDEIMEMAQNGRIREIEWHVMPNIIRVLAVDGRIFHLRNENKGIDIRSEMINAGIKIGKGGIDFRHVF
jgi:hypothetical protein